MQHSEKLVRSRAKRWGHRPTPSPTAQGKLPSTKRWSRRRALATLQVVLVLPILVLMTVAIIQFGILILVEQAVTHAATVAAREAGKGADVDQLACVVETMLCPHNVKLGPNASLVLEDLEADTPVEQRGTLPCTAPSTPSLDADEVRVTVCVELSKKPFLNALKCVGLDLAGRRFSVSSVVKKEIAG